MSIDLLVSHSCPIFKKKSFHFLILISFPLPCLIFYQRVVTVQQQYFRLKLSGTDHEFSLSQVCKQFCPGWKQLYVHVLQYTFFLQDRLNYICFFLFVFVFILKETITFIMICSFISAFYCLSLHCFYICKYTTQCNVSGVW